MPHNDIENPVHTQGQTGVVHRCSKSGGNIGTYRELEIADRDIGNGEWDMGLYFSELKKINEMGFDIRLIGADVDLSLLDFSPDLTPSIAFSDVTESQISNASDRLGAEMSGKASEKAIEGVEVMCPSCAHTFRFTGQ